MNAAQILMSISASIVLLLGCVHLLFTYYGPKLRPRDTQVVTQMQNTSARISRQANMWKAWIGFNASHSLGAILFGLIYGYLALQQPALLFSSLYLQSLGLLTLLSYLGLAWRYWFNVPLWGVSLASLAYVCSLISARAI